MYSNFHFDSKKLKSVIRLLMVTAFAANLSCSSNVFSEMALKNENTDEALWEDAVEAINAGDYDTAISKVESITSAYRREPKVAKTIAAAYAGKCGLDFLQLIVDIGGTSTSTPMMILMNAFQTRSVSPSHCYSAQLAMEAAFGSSSSARSGDINLFMAILGMAKMGTYLRSLADADGNGAVDGAFADACLAGTISDANVKQVGTGLGLVLDNLTSLTAAVAGSSALTDLDTLKTTCGAPCVITDPNSTSLNAATIKVFRSIIKHIDFGIQNCNDPTIIGCCP